MLFKSKTCWFQFLQTLLVKNNVGNKLSNLGAIICRVSSNIPVNILKRGWNLTWKFRTSISTGTSNYCVPARWSEQFVGGLMRHACSHSISKIFLLVHQVIVNNCEAIEIHGKVGKTLTQHWFTIFIRFARCTVCLRFHSWPRDTWECEDWGEGRMSSEGGGVNLSPRNEIEFAKY